MARLGRLHRLATCLACFAGLPTALPLHAAILDVPDDYPQIQSAFDASANGDTVLVARGVWTEQLVSPTHSINLFSHHAFTGDTLDVQQTVLDGQGVGTILRVRSLAPDSLVLQGFTLARGLGAGNQAGALQLEEDVSLSVRFCHFEDNQGGNRGAVLRTVGMYPETRIRLSHVTLHDNARSPQIDPYGDCIRIQTVGSVTMSHMSVLPIVDGFNTGIAVVMADTLSIRCLEVSGAPGFGFDSYVNSLDIDSFVVRDMQVNDFRLTGDFVAAKRLHFLGLEQRGNTIINLYADSLITVDSLVLRDCWARMPDASSSPLILLSMGCGNFVSSHRSRLSHFEFVNNQGGDSLLLPGLSQSTRLFSVGGMSLEDGRIAGNVMHVWSGSADGQYSVQSPLVKVHYSGIQDTARVTRCLFENNLLVDHDVYNLDPALPQYPNKGRSLGITIGGNEEIFPRRLEIDHLLFRNERQPNHVPEAEEMGSNVGSAFHVEALHGLVDPLHIHDIVMEGIDDGGMFLDLAAATNIVERVTLSDVNRMGIYATGGGDHEYSIRNVFIDGIVEQDMLQPYPYGWSMQAALIVGSAYTASNVTIVNADMTNLLMTYGTATNILVANSEYDYFNNPAADLFGNPSFAYVYADIEVSGTGNIVGSDPRFDPLQGAPWLASDSPCIDAGHTAAAFRDREDPSNPGWALWPSQGGVRNDIGFTGGPHAAVPDTDWVAVEPIERPAMPRGFTLGDPWPNPFNPMSHIAYELAVPSKVRLSVHDLLGRRVKMLDEGRRAAGRHEATIDGSGWASGLYFVTLEAAGRAQTRKVLLVR